ncbi:MAG TPA: hypothetical protein VLK84_13285 [Longimicrobium sp.]|nr:hypothetical protein [Longimicrobium sp.]
MMDRTEISTGVRQFLDTLGPVVIRPGDPPVSVKGSGGGVLVTGSAPREPIPEELLEKVRERMRELANTPPAAPPGQDP